ncbi:glycoside hydrolase family 3 C-terminal domain-containing protein [Archangium violaceum]|uniref:glycoside hydrolase family 3 protein n=1 Tax=Archangium violaceum TaxID=83451 RepID=UPI00193B8EBD|nr:glycoside hydrolase family 3 N-terminal domain-containing protein [Archangium violaceum]QRK06309.1 glycoside hydrolase family 3 C-terminal domain-containing protein [Archangium violaceum]
MSVSSCSKDIADASAAHQVELGGRGVGFIVKDGLRFKDLNKNGQVEPYEDWRRTPEERARDLLGRMTLQEKAGVMMHGTAPTQATEGVTRYDRALATRMIAEKGVNSFITRLDGAARFLAEENNALQEIAEATRLGIPATISTDPRNHFQFTPGASVAAGSFSQWPEVLGFAAIGDEALMRRFGDIARREYRAVGIQEALSPQADLATEPRWSRINGTFGEDADLARKLVRAYIEGFQNGGEGIGRDSVVAVVKHWVGYGAAKDGFDSHNAYGKYAVFPGNNFEYHVKPFEGAFAAKTGGVMPTYSILEGVTLNGQPLEQVGAGFNKQLLTDLLRGRYGFDGVILSDWAITNDCDEACVNGAPPGQKPSFVGFGTPWGVETLSRVERFAKGVNAGLDQFGGVDDPDALVAAVNAGLVTEARLDESVYRILLQKFQQGLFENPYVDVEGAGEVVGSSAFQEEATEAQRRSLVLLENKNEILPLKANIRKVYLHGIEGAVAARYGLTVVGTPEEADVAIIRTEAPFETLHPQYVFGLRQHEGNLAFEDGNADYEIIKSVSAKVPTLVTVYLDRPAILTNVKDKVSALLGNFGVSDSALFDVLTGKAEPRGKLPFELPSSMAEVEARRSDMPHDTAHPLYPVFFGLGYRGRRDSLPLQGEDT